MRALVALFSILTLVVMIGLTTAASLDRGILQAWDELWPDLWFRATLADAYFAFFTVYLWIAWRERTLAARALWLLLLVGLGSMGIALYLLLRFLPGQPGGDGAGSPGRRAEATG